MPEVEYHRLLRRWRLPQPDRQAVRVVAGRRRFLDAWWQRFRLASEIDGAAHMRASSWLADMRRHNEITARADAVLRGRLATTGCG